MAPDKNRKRQAEDDLLDWFTISYRTIWIWSIAFVAVAAAGLYFYYVWNAPIPAASPAATPTVTTARFTSLEGNVQVRPNGTTDWVSADSKTALGKRDLVRTSPGAAAEITFFDGTVVHMRPDSLLTVEEQSEDPSTKARKVSVNIPSGIATFQTTRKNVPDSSAGVSMPGAKGTFGEMTQAEVEVNAGGDSSIRAFQGSVKAETKGGQTVQLGTSEGLKVDATGRAGPKIVLPGMPLLLAPAHLAEITYVDPSRATTLLLWKPVLGSISYHLMLDYSPYFNRPLVDRKGIKDTQQELRGLDVGKYFWRVAAVDKDGEQGSFSDSSRFTVARPSSGGGGEGPPTPLTIESIDVRTNILQIKGKTEPGATITVNNQRVEVDADGSFNDFITLEKAGKQTVTIRATGLNGGVNELRRVVEVSY